MSDDTQATQAQSATEGTSAQETATSSTQQQPEQRQPSQSTTPVAPEATQADAGSATTEGDEIRDPAAYAKAQEEKFQRLLDKKEKALQDSQSQLTKLEARLKTMEESQQADFQKELDELKSSLEKERQEAETARVENLRMKVAVAAGLSPDLAERLKGTTEEEITEDAKRLVELLPTKQVQQSSPLGNRAGGDGVYVPQWTRQGNSGFGKPE